MILLRGQKIYVAFAQGCKPVNHVSLALAVGDAQSSVRIYFTGDKLSFIAEEN